jgi:hypothetical protein
LNGKVIEENLVNELAGINKDNLIEIQVIDKRQLKMRFNERGRVGVILTIRK